VLPAALRWNFPFRGLRRIRIKDAAAVFSAEGVLYRRWKCMRLTGLNEETI
jgi:hypothetical protein